MNTLDKNRQLSADLGIELYENLIEARRLYLHPALSEAIKNISVIEIDHELHRLVPPNLLNDLARLGLRGELVFPVPSVLKYAPSLLGYYRMLLGFSKKEFIKRGFGSWVKSEENNRLSAPNERDLEEHCSYLIQHLSTLVTAMGKFDERDLNDLALLTLGPTLQGGRNNVIGSNAEHQIFELIHTLIGQHVTYIHGSNNEI